jgi:hypothetical protein
VLRDDVPSLPDQLWHEVLGPSRRIGQRLRQLSALLDRLDQDGALRFEWRADTRTSHFEVSFLESIPHLLYQAISSEAWVDTSSVLFATSDGCFEDPVGELCPVWLATVLDVSLQRAAPDAAPRVVLRDPAGRPFTLPFAHNVEKYFDPSVSTVWTKTVAEAIASSLGARKPEDRRLLRLALHVRLALERTHERQRPDVHLAALRVGADLVRIPVADGEVDEVTVGGVGDLVSDARTRWAGHTVPGSKGMDLVAVAKEALALEHVEHLVLALVCVERAACAAGRETVEHDAQAAPALAHPLGEDAPGGAPVLALELGLLRSGRDVGDEGARSVAHGGTTPAGGISPSQLVYCRRMPPGTGWVKVPSMSGGFHLASL